MPELNYLFTRGQRDLLARASLLAMKLVSLVAGMAGIGLWLLLPVIYPRWTGKSLVFDPVLLMILLTQVVLAAGWTTSGWALLASNQHRRLSCLALANGTITVGLAALLAPRWGVHGVALASLCGDLLFGLAVYPMLASKALGLSRARLFKTILVPMIALIPLWSTALLAIGGQAIRFEQSCLLALASALLIVLGALWSFHKKDDTEWILIKLRALAH
jgi:O-antigen/teichoic acid export membrane protein